MTKQLKWYGPNDTLPKEVSEAVGYHLDTESEIARLTHALKLIALQVHDVELPEPVDWETVADTLVGIARATLEGADYREISRSGEP